MSNFKKELLSIYEEEGVTEKILNEKTKNIPTVGYINDKGITVLPADWYNPEDDDL